MSFIDILKDVLPPPNSPAHAPSGEDIEAIENKYGLKFQGDFKEFMKICDCGTAYDTFRLLSAGSSDYTSQIEWYRDLYSSHQSVSPKSYHLELWPQAPGIFPLGSSSNGEILFWVVGEDGETRGVTVFEKTPDYYYYDGSLTGFLYGCIAGDYPYIHEDFLSSEDPFIVAVDPTK